MSEHINIQVTDAPADFLQTNPVIGEAPRHQTAESLPTGSTTDQLLALGLLGSMTIAVTIGSMKRRKSNKS